MTNETPQPATPDAADPSMEEILASIRRILNDEDAPATTGEAGEAPAADEDVLVLDDSMLVSAPEGRPEAEAPEPALVVEPEHVDPPEPKPVTTSLPAERPRAAMEASTSPSDTDPKEPASSADLLAPAAAAAAASSVGTLKRTLAANRAAQVHGGGPTLEDIARTELRPLLKEWLDANLASIVERLVRAEIERVVNREIP